jgi:hypothetical protein
MQPGGIRRKIDKPPPRQLSRYRPGLVQALYKVYTHNAPFHYFPNFYKMNVKTGLSYRKHGLQSMIIHLKTPVLIKLCIREKTVPLMHIGIYSVNPISALTTLTMRATYSSHCSEVGASAITRTSGSVPDGRTRIRPFPSISASTSEMTA